MIGAIIGDVVGSRFEFDNYKSKNFEMFDKGCDFTDDSVMTLAIAKVLQPYEAITDYESFKKELVAVMHEVGMRYSHCGYGGRFYVWIMKNHTEPYNSFGNGSAMRVSSVGWLFDTLERTREVARWSAEVTHNHPEGIKGAESIASVIWMARNGKSKDEIKDYIMKEFGYDLSRTCDEIRPEYRHVESCMETCPEAITAFLEGEDFEDVIRTAVSLGGDCDTLTDIATGMGEAFYGLPEQFKTWVYELTTDAIHEVMKAFEEKALKRTGAAA